MRLNAKKQMADYLFHRERTGNFQNHFHLDDTTQRIYAIYGKFGTGLSIIHEIGIFDPMDVNSKDQYFLRYFIINSIFITK